MALSCVVRRDLSFSADLGNEEDVLAVYLGGSLAEGNPDLYSDIDLRIVVKPEAYDAFLADKLRRPGTWGNRGQLIIVEASEVGRRGRCVDTIC